MRLYFMTPADCRASFRRSAIFRLSTRPGIIRLQLRGETKAEIFFPLILGESWKVLVENVQSNVGAFDGKIFECKSIPQ